MALNFEDIGKYEHILLADYDAAYENALSFLTDSIGMAPPWQDVSTSGKWSQVTRDDRKVLLEVWERVEILGQDPWDKPMEYGDLLLFEFQTFFVTEERTRLVFDLRLPNAIVIANQLYQFLTTLWACEKFTVVDEQPAPAPQEVQLPPSPTPSSDEDIPPWEKVDDYLWDRKLVKCLHNPEYKDYDWGRIAQRILKDSSNFKKLSASRVASRASELRKIYGEQIVPMRQSGRKPD